MTPLGNGHAIEPSPSVAAACSRPELIDLCGSLTVSVGGAIGQDFVIGATGAIALSLPIAADVTATAVALRHAAELLHWRAQTTSPVLLAIIGGRVGGLYLKSLPIAEANRARRFLSPDLLAFYDIATSADPFGGDRAERLLALLPTILPLQGAHLCPTMLSAALDAAQAPFERVRDLAAPTDHLLSSGGDLRLRLDPATAQNQYGCSPRPRPEVIQAATTTASSLSLRAFSAAERLRETLLSGALAGHEDEIYTDELARIRQSIRDTVGADAQAEIVLTPSGTDTEFYAVELALAATQGRLTNLIVAPEETGSGIVHAAVGRHFNGVTALGEQVDPGATIAGCREGRITLASVPFRAESGEPLPAGEIDLAVDRLVEQAVERGDRVLLHLIDVSKTGLILPSVACVDRLKSRFPDAIDVVVDACQMRISRANLRAYGQRGYMLMITGSKFFCGPPFSGALVVPQALAERACHADSLPCGFQSYSSRDLWPDLWSSLCRDLPEGRNPGLMLRWEAALAEIAQFDGVPEATRHARLAEYAAAVTGLLAADPNCLPVPTPVPDRGGDGWDHVQTIFPFMLAGAHGEPLSLADAKIVHRLLNADLSAALPSEHRRVAATRCHIGQAVKIGMRHGDAVGALRLAAGSGLVDDAVSLADKIDEIQLILDKVGLILRHFDSLARVDGQLAAQEKPALV